MIQVHYPPVTPFERNNSLRVFLAGTIEMGNSRDWQRDLCYLTESWFRNQNVDIFNPRRPDWDNSWEQSPTHPMFKQQVEWELKQLEKADLILMVLLEESQSPISLMELGLFHKKPMMVYNPHNFRRYGNVEITCRRYNVPTFHDWDDYLMAVKRTLQSFVNKYTSKNYDA